jgi:hypothetical protein
MRASSVTTSSRNRATAQFSRCLKQFSFAVSQGEPGLLLFRFDGTPGASPTYHSVTIHVGSQTQTLHVTVLPTNPFQRVANITNPSSVSAPAGSAISVLLTTT